MRCVWAALVAAACAAAQNEAIAALVAKYKKSAGGSPARQPDAPSATRTVWGAGGSPAATAPARQPVAGRAATNEARAASSDAANLNDVVGLFAWPKKPRTVWAADALGKPATRTIRRASERMARILPRDARHLESALIKRA